MMSASPGTVEQAVQLTEQQLGTSELTIFSMLDPGDLLIFCGNPTCVAQYAIWESAAGYSNDRTRTRSGLICATTPGGLRESCRQRGSRLWHFTSQLAQYPHPEIALVA
jgi:hypothetical protein